MRYLTELLELIDKIWNGKSTDAENSRERNYNSRERKFELEKCSAE